jgi:hypothetical protein
VLFRSQTAAQAGAFYRALVVPQRGLVEPLPAVGLLITVLAAAVCHFLGCKDRWRRLAERLPAPLLGAAYSLMLTLALVLAPWTDKAFIYFQF